MEPLSANTANTGSDEFVDPHDPDDPEDLTTHVSIGAADGILGSTSDSWEAINQVSDSTANSPGGTARAATAPGQPLDTAPATGSAMDGPPPPKL